MTRLTLQLTDEEREALEERARAAGLTVEAYIKSRVLPGGEKPFRPIPVGVLKDEVPEDFDVDQALREVREAWKADWADEA